MWGVSVIVDNRPGASGNIGTSLCAKVPPDGYIMWRLLSLKQWHHESRATPASILYAISRT
jgi:hypothetical protein